MIVIQTSRAVRIGAASLRKPAVTAIIRENRRIPDAVAAASAVCFSQEPSDHHIDLI
jgi:hypothetical protein